MRRLVALAALGAILGTFAEAAHQKAGVWVLGNGLTFPGWIAAVYFIALLGAGVGLNRIEDALAPRPEVSATSVVVEVILFAVLFLLPPILHRHELLLAMIAAGYVLVRLALFRARGDVTVAAVLAASDLVIELCLAAASFYRYANAALLPVPLWLAPLWAGLALGLRRFFLFAAR
jgi:hypothetical protein